MVCITIVVQISCGIRNRHVFFNTKAIRVHDTVHYELNLRNIKGKKITNLNIDQTDQTHRRCSLAPEAFAFSSLLSTEVPMLV